MAMQSRTEAKQRSEEIEDWDKQRDKDKVDGNKRTVVSVARNCSFSVSNDRMR